MRLRKTKPAADEGRGRRSLRQGTGQQPAFSYYSNRSSEAPRDRAAERKQGSAPDKPAKTRATLRLAQLPVLLLVLLAVVCVVKFVLLSTNPKVIMLGNSAVSSTYAQQTTVYASAAHKLLASSVTNRTKLTVNLGGTASSLERQFPELQTVSLGVPLAGSRPIVYVQVAQPSLVLQTAAGNYALNASGLVLARLQSLPAGVPVVVDQSGVTPQPGKQSLPGSTIVFIQTVAYQFAAAHVGISAYVLAANSPYELDVRLDGKPYVVRCNLQADALTQSGAAVATIEQLAGSTPANYLDVRVPGRVYYK